MDRHQRHIITRVCGTLFIFNKVACTYSETKTLCHSMPIPEFELTDQRGCIEFKEVELFNALHCISFTFIHSADPFLQIGNTLQ